MCVLVATCVCGWEGKYRTFQLPVWSLLLILFVIIPDLIEIIVTQPWLFKKRFWSCSFYPSFFPFFCFWVQTKAADRLLQTVHFCKSQHHPHPLFSVSIIRQPSTCNLLCVSLFLFAVRFIEIHYHVCRQRRQKNIPSAQLNSSLALM